MKKYLLFLAVIVCGLCIQCSSSEDNDSFVDIDAPSNPSRLIASEVTETTLKLAWDASTDNVGVASYSIYKNDIALKSTSSTTTVIDNLLENTNYTFKVKANDAAGNKSGFSNSVNVTTKFSSVLQAESGSIQNYVGNLIDNFPGSSGDNYSEPNNSELTIWQNGISFMLENKLNEAITEFGKLAYQVIEFTDTSLGTAVFYIVKKKTTGTNYWGVYVFSKTPVKSNLVLMAPHSKYDTNTGKQALYCFKNNQAKALLLNGTHRCNNSSTSSCSGTTSACGSSSSYRISDMAHTTTSIFQKTTDILFNTDVNSVFVQLHGFGKTASDPYVIMSNGTRETPSTDYALKIKDELLIEDNSLTFKIAHIDTDWTRLIGFTNTQGRLINNSSNPCNSNAGSSSGRFIHIEQEKSKLRDNEDAWKKMSNALKNAF
ncbi:fibronectin type III domain-containing protein [Tenacibaculum crassostreae]|uniref:fibronectin type III domain-containing protein n=1 Tax=Tenacibaculum crassostreae TaxID=502683 RepID=UPI003892F7F8